MVICGYCNKEVNEVKGTRRHCFNCIFELWNKTRKEKSEIQDKLIYTEKVYTDICKEMLELKIKLKQEESFSKTFLDEYNEGRI